MALALPDVRIAFGTDEETALTDAVVTELERSGHDVEHVGRGEAWPEVGRAVGEAVAAGRVDRAWSAAGRAPASALTAIPGALPQPVRVTATGFGIGIGSNVSTAS
jgi:ribose 5-phosphate isomerase RpiB